MKQRAFDYLGQNRLANIDMLEMLQLPDVRVVLAGGSGVLLEHDSLFALACEPGCGTRFLPLLTQGADASDERMIVLHGAELLDALTQDCGFTTIMDCRNAAYLLDTPVPYVLPQGAQIRPLDTGHVEFVHAHYRTVDDIGYIRERIEAGMFGVFVRGEPAGFCGTHDERSMGLLEILPDYRRLGLGYCLEAYLINHLLALGRVPFCQIAIQNTASLRLQQKLGLTLAPAVIHWLGRKQTH